MTAGDDFFFFFLRFIYLFGCAESLLLPTGFLELQRESGTPLHSRAPRRGGLSGCEAWAPGASAVAVPGLRSTGSRVVMLRLSGSEEHGLLRTRDQTLSPALAGRFLTTRPGKPQEMNLHSNRRSIS